MPLSARRRDDADVIRARLRQLLADADPVVGWVPDDPAPTGSGRDGGVGWNRPSEDDPAEARRLDSGDSGNSGAMVRGGTSQTDHRDQGATDEAAGDGAAGDGAAGDEAELPAGIGRHRSPGPTVRWSPGRSGARSLWLAGLGAALLLVGWTWIDRPRVEPVPAAASHTAAPRADVAAPTEDVPPGSAAGGATDAPAAVVVSVIGLVAEPGLVTLPAGARVADALDAVGGLLPGAHADAINQAAVVSDGQQIAVGVVGAAPAPQVGVPEGGDGVVNLNTATVAQLDALPGIGPVLAQRIVDHRGSAGPFGSVEELDDVAGIGPAIAEELAGRVAV